MKTAFYGPCKTCGKQVGRLCDDCFAHGYETHLCLDHMHHHTYMSDEGPQSYDLCDGCEAERVKWLAEHQESETR